MKDFRSKDSVSPHQTELSKPSGMERSPQRLYDEARDPKTDKGRLIQIVELMFGTIIEKNSTIAKMGKTVSELQEAVVALEDEVDRLKEGE